MRSQIIYAHHEIVCTLQALASRTHIYREPASVWHHLMASKSSQAAGAHGMAALSVVAGRAAETELQNLRALTCELEQYRQLLPDMITAPAMQRAGVHTVSLKARSDMPNSVDNVRVASLLAREEIGPFVQSFAFNEASNIYGCAWFVVKFRVARRDDVGSMHSAVALFLEALRDLADCHRICQTINFADEYDGGVSWDGEGEERARSIIDRLPAKTVAEARPLF